MDHRSIGPLSVSTVGLGCNNFGRKLNQADSTAVVRAALDADVDFFDVADVYGGGDHSYSGKGRSEEFLGVALAGNRQDVIIATKFGMSMDDTDPAMGGGGAAWVKRACDDSLRRLQTDYIDLYQMHRPDEGTDIAETLGALNELVDEGKVRAIGCSNFTAGQLEEADSVGAKTDSARFQSVQNEYSLLRREAERDVLPVCENLDIAFVPYFPLASGLLTGKYRKGEAAPPGTRLAFWEPRPHQTLSDEILDEVERFAEVARAFGHTLLELAFSWLLAQPQVPSVIAGATSPKQVRDNVAAATWVLAPEELAAVDSL